MEFIRNERNTNFNNDNNNNDNDINNAIIIDTKFISQGSKTNVFDDRVPAPSWDGSMSNSGKKYIFCTEIKGPTRVFWEMWKFEGYKPKLYDAGFRIYKNGNTWMLQFSCDSKDLLNSANPAIVIRNVSDERDRLWNKIWGEYLQSFKEGRSLESENQTILAENNPNIVKPFWKGFLENDVYIYRSPVGAIKGFWPFWKKCESKLKEKGFTTTKVFDEWCIQFSYTSKKAITENSLKLIASRRDDAWEEIWTDYRELKKLDESD